MHGVGIALITEKHLTGTHLDGAVMWHPDGFPVAEEIIDNIEAGLASFRAVAATLAGPA